MSESQQQPDSPPPPPAKGGGFDLAAITRKLGPAGPLALAASFLPPLGSIVLFTYMNSIGAWLRGHEESGLVLYSCAFAILAGVALLPTYASAILGGWAFGFATGYPAALAGFFGGSLIGYAIARPVASERVSKLIHEKPKWEAVRNALVGRGFWGTLGIVTLLRLPPNSPFALTNLVMASVRVPLPCYLLGTLIGMAPRTGIVLFVASTLREMTAAEAAKQRPWWLIPIGIGLTLIVLGVIGLIAKHALQRVTQNARTQSSEAGVDRAAAR